MQDPVKAGSCPPSERKPGRQNRCRYGKFIAERLVWPIHLLPRIVTQLHEKESPSMRSMNLFFCAMLMFAFFQSSMVASETKATAPQMTAAAIVDKNAAARGGLAAWRAVQTMEMKGKMEAGGNQRAALPVAGGRGAAM